MEEIKFLGRTYSAEDNTWRFKDGSCPIPEEFRQETLIIVESEKCLKSKGYLGGLGAVWLGKKFALEDFLKKQNPKEWEKLLDNK